MKNSLLIVAALVPMAALSALPALSATSVSSDGRSHSHLSGQDNQLAKAKNKTINKKSIKRNSRVERQQGPRTDPYVDPGNGNLPSPPPKRRIA